MIRGLGKPVALLVVVGTMAACAAPPPAAAAFDPTKPICTLAGLVSTLAGKVCSTARHPGRLVSAGTKLLGGHLGGALSALSGSETAVKALTAGAALAAVVGWVSGGTRFALHETAAFVSATSRPELQSSWFSAFYWRMAGISALLTLPLLFAAAIQALMRADMAMLARSAFAYLPLGLLAVSIATPVTMLLLAASDELSAIVSSASGDAGGSFLAHAGVVTTGLGAISGSTFLEFFVGLLTVTATVTLWVELLIRSAAVYVIVLMLPLFFAALVWPARRVWAVRAVEVLVALILSKFVIVAVLSLGGAALGHTLIPSFTQTLEGTTLVVLAAFSPWALLRLLPLHELASGLDGLRARAQPFGLAAGRGDEAAQAMQAQVRDLTGALVQRVSLPSGEPDAADGAVQGLARNAGGVAGSDAEDGATNGPAGAPEADGAGPETARSFPAPAGTVGSEAAGPAVGGEPARSAEAPSAEGSAEAPPDPASTVAASTSPDPRPPMESRWPAANGSWPTVILGPGALPPELPPESKPSAAPELPAGPKPPSDVASDPGIEHDRRPPAQEPDGGLL